jgi:hypothetical protein
MNFMFRNVVLPIGLYHLKYVQVKYNFLKYLLYCILIARVERGRIGWFGHP